MNVISNFISFAKRGFKPKLIRHVPGEMRTYQHWNGKISTYCLNKYEGDNYLFVDDILDTHLPRHTLSEFAPYHTSEPLPLSYSASTSYFKKVDGYVTSKEQTYGGLLLNEEIKANGRVIYSSKHGGERYKTIDELEKLYPEWERMKQAWKIRDEDCAFMRYMGDHFSSEWC